MLRTPHVSDPALERVRAFARPIAVEQGLALVDVAWSSDRGTRVLRVVLELEGLGARQLEAQLDALASGQALDVPPDPAGGVSLEDCARFSRKLSEALDADEGAVPGAYLLEVSSPGLERPLLSIADFVRFRGLVARVKLARAASDGQKLLRGRIEALDGLDEAGRAELAAGALALREADALRLVVRVDGKRIVVPFGDVVEASLVYVFEDEAPRRAPGKSASSKPRSREASSTPKGAKPSKKNVASAGEAGASKTPERPRPAENPGSGAQSSQASRTRSRT
jgi:ribosome maturation factor RimP